MFLRCHKIITCLWRSSSYPHTAGSSGNGLGQICLVPPMEYEKVNWMAPGKNHVTAFSTEIFKYVRIHPNFASRPVWCEKMFLCCFSLKAGRKDLTNRPKVLSPHPPTPPPPHCFLPCSTGFLISRVSKFSIFQEERSNWENWVCVWGGGGKGGGVGDRTSGLFVKSFLPASRKKQHRNIFSNHTGRLAKFGWIRHTWKFQSKWRLHGSCPEPFNYMASKAHVGLWDSGPANE